MQREVQDIEVEVVEIDGVPTEKPQAQPDHGRPAWRQWTGHLRGLSPAWWPLAIILGIIAIALLLTIGVVIGACYLVFSLIRGMARAFNH